MCDAVKAKVEAKLKMQDSRLETANTQGAVLAATALLPSGGLYERERTLRRRDSSPLITVMRSL